jgi:UDP-N-acetylmuramyl pentapeptide phosphotransferase/UDP-N-acetylglucosamine-1-phosphate transferase
MPDTQLTVPVVNEAVKKPGYKSTEFYMSMLAVIVGAVASSGILEGSDGLTKVVGLVMAALVALGYTGSRLTLKKLDTANGNGTTGNTGNS